jgi:hypothetical protein
MLLSAKLEEPWASCYGCGSILTFSRNPILEPRNTVEDAISIDQHRSRVGTKLAWDVVKSNPLGFVCLADQGLLVHELLVVEDLRLSPLFLEHNCEVAVVSRSLRVMRDGKGLEFCWLPGRSSDWLGESRSSQFTWSGWRGLEFVGEDLPDPTENLGLEGLFLLETLSRAEDVRRLEGVAVGAEDFSAEEAAHMGLPQPRILGRKGCLDLE